uniref:Uncharacterized protein n=1 Tax=Solanum lycopersicum TaxID=4081 RepID=A0A3Q7EWH8_SOLLC
MINFLHSILSLLYHDIRANKSLLTTIKGIGSNQVDLISMLVSETPFSIEGLQRRPYNQVAGFTAEAEEFDE